MARRNIRFRGRGRARPRPLYRWTTFGGIQSSALLTQASPSALNFANFTCIGPDEYQQTSSLEAKGPTLMRMVGDIHIAVTMPTTGDQNPHFITVTTEYGFVHVAEGEDVPDPSDFQDRFEEDWIWVRQHCCGIETQAVVGNVVTQDQKGIVVNENHGHGAYTPIPFDLKGRRKLNSSFVVMCASTSAIGLLAGDSVILNLSVAGRLLVTGRF